jgi:hypothetical protein
MASDIGRRPKGVVTHSFSISFTFQSGKRNPLTKRRVASKRYSPPCVSEKDTGGAAGLLTGIRENAILCLA